MVTLAVFCGVAFSLFLFLANAIFMIRDPERWIVTFYGWFVDLQNQQSDAKRAMVQSLGWAFAVLGTVGAFFAIASIVVILRRIG